jgi:hypothetical protein
MVSYIISGLQTGANISPLKAQRRGQTLGPGGQSHGKSHGFQAETLRAGFERVDREHQNALLAIMLANFENALCKPMCGNLDVSQFKSLILLI